MVSRFSIRGTASAGGPQLAYGATIAFISVLCTVVVGHDLFRTWQDRNIQLEGTRREVANLSWAAEQHIEGAFLLANTVLTGIAERVTTDGTGAPQLERLRLLMAQWIAGSPALLSLSVIDAEGMLIAPARPVSAPIEVLDRAYFQYHKANPDLRPYVSPVLRAKLTGKFVIPLSIRMNNADGSFAGVAAASIETGYLQAFYATFDLGHSGLAGLYRDDGTLLVREPILASAVGGNFGGIPLFHDLLPKAPTGTFEAVSSLDGETRIISYRRVTGYPLVVFAALGKNEQLAAWRTGAIEHLLTTAAIAALLAFVGVRLVMQVRRLTRAEQETAAATEAARIAAERYQLIADNASDMIVTLDMQFTRQYVSPACRELIGYEPEELLDGTPVELTHPEDSERVQACLGRIAAGQERDLITYRARRRDGRWIWVEVSFRLIRDPDHGVPMQIWGAARDVTERNSAEAALRDRDRELERTSADLREAQLLNTSVRYARDLLEASLDPMFRTNPEGMITDVNEATILVTGGTREMLIGTHFSDYFTEPARAREAYRRVFAEGSVTDYPLTIRDKNDGLIQVLYNASVHKNADGVVLGMFAAARDVTARVTAEAEIAEQRAKEHDRLEELERFQRVTVGRELKMIDLKKEILALKASAGERPSDVPGSQDLLA
jgi:PAS domain S-box-containing protein